MPAERRERIAADFAEAARGPELLGKLRAMGMTVRAGTPADAQADLNDQRSKIEAAVKLMK
jgi:hypothetical protein